MTAGSDVKDSLPGQAHPEIAAIAELDPEASDNIVSHLAAASVDSIVDRREIMFEVDPTSDNKGAR